MSQHKINVTLKGGPGYDAPWVTIGGDSEAEAALNLRAVVPGSEADDFFALVAEAAASLKGFYTATDQLGATAQAADPTAPWDKPQPAAPAFAVAQPQYAAAPAAAAAPGPVCMHGPRTHRSGNGAKGQWQAYFCPTPKGTPNQCDPQWVRQGEPGWVA